MLQNFLNIFECLFVRKHKKIEWDVDVDNDDNNEDTQIEPSRKEILDNLELLQTGTDEVKANSLLNLAHMGYLSDIEDRKLLIKNLKSIIEYLKSDNSLIKKNCIKFICENSIFSTDFQNELAKTGGLEYLFDVLRKDTNPTLIAWSCYGLCLATYENFPNLERIRLLHKNYKGIIDTASSNSIWLKCWDVNYGEVLKKLIEEPAEFDQKEFE